MTKSSVATVLDELSLTDEIVEEDALVILLETETLELEKTETGLEQPVKMNKVSSCWEDQAGKLVCRWVFED